MLGAVVTIFIPVSAEEALAHSQELIGEPSDEYCWKCPAADGRSFTYEVLCMQVDAEDFLDSIDDGILRQGTRLVPCPYNLVDPGDPYVRIVADHILEKTEGYTDEMRAQAALNFVQCAICYEYDDRLYGCEDFWASPIETLYLHQGDCEDTSTLLCSIYLAMGLRCAMLDFPGHVAVGWYPGDSEDFLYCETTYSSPHAIGYGWGHGEPDVYDDFSGSVLTGINGLFAGYRGLIRSVTGT